MKNEEYNVETSKRILEINEGDNVYKINIEIKYRKLYKYLILCEKEGDYHKAFEELLTDEENNIKYLSIQNQELIIEEIIKEYGLNVYNKQIFTKDNFKKIYELFAMYIGEKNKKIEKALECFANGTKKIIETIAEFDVNSKIEKALQLLNYWSTEVIEKYKNFDLQIEEKIQNYIKWAEYGWTIIPKSSFDFFESNPKKQEIADNKCLEMITDEDINTILEYLLKNIKQKQKLEEAIKCYDQKCYLASAMILTSLIERNITELPMKDPKEKKPRKKEIIIHNFKEPLNIEERYIIEYFYFENLLGYIEKLFEDGRGFVNEPYNINRNFLMHGWRDFETTKTDCIKLILALYNILFLWNNISAKEFLLNEDENI